MKKNILNIIHFIVLVLAILIFIGQESAFAQYSSPTPGGGNTPTPGGNTPTPGGNTPILNPTVYPSVACSQLCGGVPNCNSTSTGQNCGGWQLCPAPAGQCAQVSGGIAIGTCGDTSCWSVCCNGGPALTPTPLVATPTPNNFCNGGCTGGATCANCGFCGACPSPPPAGSPVPTAPPGNCGNGTCGAGESCANCPADCGSCPGPTATPTPGGVTNIQSRAVLMNTGDDCTAVRASATAIPGATLVHSFAAAPAPSPAPKTQSGTNYVDFGPSTAGSYTISVAGVPPNYVLQKACWLTSNPSAGEGISAFISNGQTFRWDLGYTLGTAWVQTQGGDVYAGSTLKSLLPSSTVFNRSPALPSGDFPGVVTYGVNYDFDPDASSTGPSLVSSKNWLVNESYFSSDFYQTFYRRFGSPTTDTSGFDPAVGAKPVNGVYYVSGNVTITAPWTVNDADSIVVIVGGTLTINQPIKLASPNGSGFVGFITQGGVTVSSAVGGVYSSSTPVVEGVYITNGTFATGTSVSGTERLVGKGIFVANNFALQRDLEVVNQNTAASAELFVYNPRFLITMPDTMRDLPVTWQEVAP